MKNINLRNVLMAAGLAVFAGVLTLGVNAAFGLDAPSQDPAGAALHSPVFDSVDVQGGLANSAGDLAIYDDTIVNGELTINPAMGGISVTGNLGKLPLNANLWVGGKNYQDANSVTIDGDTGEIIAEDGTLTIKNILDMQGGIKNSTVGVSNVDQPVKIDDSLEVVNNAVINKDLTVSGASNFALNSVFNGVLTLNKNLITNANVYLGKSDGTSKIYGRGELIMAGGVDYASGIISGVREIKNVDSKDLWINVGAALIKMQPLTGDIYFAGNIRGDGVDPLKFKDDVEVSGALRLQSNGDNNYQDATGTWGAIELGPKGGAQLLIDRNSIDSYGGDLTINGWGLTNVNVGSNADSSNLKIYGKVTATNGFGTVSHTLWGSGANLAAGVAGSRSVTCPAGRVLLGCGYTNGSGVPINRVDFDDSNTCYVDAKNITATPFWFVAKAICLDPAN